MADESFKVGDVVRLASGGPRMTVEVIGPDDEGDPGPDEGCVGTIRFGQDGKPQRLNLPTACLRLVTDAQPDCADNVLTNEPSSEILNKPLDWLRLSSLRVHRALVQKLNCAPGDLTVADLFKVTFQDLFEMKGLGRESLEDLRRKLAEHSLKLKDD